jgi:hypothetical protein
MGEKKYFLEGREKERKKGRVSYAHKESAKAAGNTHTARTTHAHFGLVSVRA